MEIAPKKTEGLRREFSVTIKAADIGKKTDERLKVLAGEIKMPGFRPGKVPVGVVKTRYGKQVLGEVLQASIDEAAKKTVEDNGLDVATNPSVNIDQYEEGGDLKASIAFEVMPEIKPVDLGKIKIEKPVIEVADKEVDEAVARIAEDNKPTKPVETPRAVKNGDTVVIDFIGRIDGQAFDGGSGKGHHLGIGSNSFIPGFEEGLIGAMPGSTVEVKVTFPDSYPAENLKGKDSVFEVTINELRESAEAKIDDDFAKSLGLADLEALKTAVREQISRQHATAIRNRIKTSVLDALDDASGAFDVPPTLYQNEYDSVCRAMNPQVPDQPQPEGAQDNTPADSGMSKSDKDEAADIAKRRVRLGMLLTNLGRKNQITVTDEEHQQAMQAEARRHPGQEQQVMEYFKNNPAAAQQLAGPVFEDKVIDFVLDGVELTEKTITADELYAADDDDAESGKAKKSASATSKTATKKTAKTTAKKKA